MAQNVGCMLCCDAYFYALKSLFFFLFTCSYEKKKKTNQIQDIIRSKCDKQNITANVFISSCQTPFCMRPDESCKDTFPKHLLILTFAFVRNLYCLAVGWCFHCYCVLGWYLKFNIQTIYSANLFILLCCIGNEKVQNPHYDRIVVLFVERNFGKIHKMCLCSYLTWF